MFGCSLCVCLCVYCAVAPANNTPHAGGWSPEFTLDWTQEYPTKNAYRMDCVCFCFFLCDSLLDELRACACVCVCGCLVLARAGDIVYHQARLSCVRMCGSEKSSWWAAANGYASEVDFLLSCWSGIFFVVVLCSFVVFRALEFFCLFVVVRLACAWSDLIRSDVTLIGWRACQRWSISFLLYHFLVSLLLV